MITYITAYRSKFTSSSPIGLDLNHTAIQITVNGKSQIWEYGRYNGPGKLIKRDKGLYHGEEMITSCQLHKPLPYETFVQESKDFCAGKKWGVNDTNTTTNCFYYALHIFQTFADNPKCLNLLNDQNQKHPLRLFKNLIQNYGQKFFDALIPPLY